MALRVPHSWQPGLQVDLREGCTAENASSRTGILPTPRRHRHLLTAVPRRSRRCRAYVKHIENVTHAVKACVPCGGSRGVCDQAETIDASSAPLQQVCRLLRLEGAEELQDLIASLILSECVYKKLELDEEGVAAKVTEFVSSFPPGWVQLQAVQLSLSGIPQHYLIATSPTSMYVAFMGTKQFQDILADANLLHTPVWAESARLAADRQSIPAAHRGFLERARAIHVEQLYELAVSRGLRLVLCGHSLGGAVAKLCTLRLLRELPDWPRPRVRCIAFATPAVGNAALAELVESAGWASRFSTYYLPEDQLVRLISFSQARTTTSSSSTGGGAVGVSGGTGGGSSARAERRRRRAKERAAQRVAVGRPATATAGGEGAAAACPASQEYAAAAAGLAAGARLDEATLGRLGAGSAAGPASPAAAAVVALEAPQQPQSQGHLHPHPHLPRVASTSSIASASSCASAVTSSTTLGGGIGSGASSSRSCDGSFGDDAPSDDGVGGAGAALLERRACRSSSLSRSASSVSRTSSSVSDGESSLDIPKPPPSPQPVLLPAPLATAAAAASTHGPPGAAAGPSFVETLDEDQAGVAMEEILAPGPDALEAAAAAGVALGGQPPADLAAAQREALYGNAGGSWGLRLALGRKRVMRRLRRLAARARIPLPKALLPVSRYHTFGEQWFVTEHGALSPEELEAALRQQKTQDQQQPPPQQPQPPQPQPQQTPPQQQQQAGTAAAGTAGAAAEGARGFFSFHRMVAYRQRHADLVARLVRSGAGGEELAGEELAVRPQPQPQSAGSSGTAAAGAAAGVGAPYCSVKLSYSLLPHISVQRALLRGVLQEPPCSDLRPSGAGGNGCGGGGNDAMGGDAAAGAAAATGRPAAAGGAPVIGHLWSWVRGGGGGAGGLYRSGGDGGGRRPGSPDESVQLDLELDGHNLQYCRKVSVALIREEPDVSAGANAAAGAAAAATAPAPPGAGFQAAGAPVTAAAARAAPGASAAGGRTARWAPFGSARGGSSSTAGAAAASAIPQQQVPLASAAAAAGAAAATTRASSPLPTSASMNSPPASTAGAAGPSGTPGPASSTEVPCEVVQVLYAQPYSDEANPPPLHPVSLFRNTLHHLAGNLMRRCRLQGQVVGPGGGLSSLGAASASASVAASVAALVGANGGGGALAEGYAGYGGPWRRFRFQPNPRPNLATNSSNSSSSSSAVGTASASATKEVKGAGALRELPGSFLAGAAANSSAGGGAAADAVAANANASAVVQMPSRLLLRVTLPRSVARGLLDGTLPGRLVVSARSDFHALSAVPVIVQRPRVAILGTSPYAASLVQAALSAPAALAAAGLEDRPGAAGGGAAAAAAAGVAAWVPPPVAWALAAVRGATAAAAVRRAAAAAANNAKAAQGPGSTAGSRSVAPGVSKSSQPQTAPWTGSGSAGTEAQRAPAAAGAGTTTGAAAADTSPRSPQRPGGGFVPCWAHLAAQAGMPRLRARVGRLRWGIRQSLAAAAVGAAAASVAGVTGAAAAVGAAAVVASTMAAFSSDGGVSVLASAAVTVAAVVAAAAAAATAFSGSEAAILIAAAASAAAVAMAATMSSGEGVTSPQQRQQQQQQVAQARAPAAAPSAAAAASPRASLEGLPTPLPSPLLAATRARTNPAATMPADAPGSGTPAPGLPAPQARRWVLRFGARAVSGQAGGGGRAAQARGGGRAAAGSAAGGAVRPVGRGWMLWWPGSAPPASEDGLATSGRPVAAAAAPPPATSPVPRWLSWPLPGAGGQARGGRPAASRTPGPSATVAAALGSIASATAAPRGATATTTAATATTATPIPAEPRRRSMGWFPPLGAAPRQLATESRHAAPGSVGGGTTAAAAAASLAQLRTQLLGSLRAGSGRAALPLPPAVLSDGLELCNVMVEPVRRTWGSGRAGAAAAAAGQHLLPLQPPAQAPAPPPPPLAPVSAAQLWRRRCRGPPEGALEPPAAAAAAAAAVVPSASAAPAEAIVGTAVATASPGLAAPGLIDPRAAAEAARAALDKATAAAAAAAASAAAAALGVMPARDGCPELVGVAPFVAVRRMEEGLRRQVLQRGIWWRALLGGVVGALLRPVALVGMLGRLPGWGLMQVLRRGHPAHGDGGAPPAPAPSAATAAADAHGRTSGTGSAERQPGHQDWGALVLVASCRDPLRVLRGRDMEALRARAADAACPVVPVLLTCAESPPGRRAAAARALAAACGVATGAVLQLVLEAGLLHTPAAAIPRSNLAAVWRGTAECEGAQQLRAAVAAAVAAAAQAERQELQQQQQHLRQSPLASGEQW
ncbi:hypothetical protein PLESTB_000973200 [Pleodorina starrii]|uniref:Fungal lipase-type domain-containing protein n=1 Tax=Pleodorina starrii TaxID=330485 RepID=A0A9W6BNI2_9CHLO|nr:hypothetical protein PLESTM_001633300 [Pleodorina starrii]GLC55329.1 hypothetical protein PLESTB_000973200 [Pleodorina starrii]GLC76306.1 hypothetical protein PLESTF_001764700 [Pleodorina starrii]